MLSELRMALIIINKVKYCNIIRMSLGRRMMMAVAALLLPFYTAVAAYIHVDYDYKGATAAEAAYLALAKAESLNTESINDILDHYSSAEVASAGIWLSKFLERKALKDEGPFGKTENHYYKVILFMVERRITPRIIRIGRELLHHPDQFLYWGPYLFKTCEDVMNLCAQFEAIVTNGKMSFSGVDFVQLSPALQEYFDFSKLGNVNWQETWDRITNFPTPTWEDFREDFKQLFDQVSPVNLAIAGEESIMGRASHIFDRFAEAPTSIPDMLDKVEDAFSSVTSEAAIRSILEGVIGDLKDSLAVTKLFNLGNYNVGNYINNYVNQLMGEFYTQLWYIYHTTGGSSSEYSLPYYTQTYNIVLTTPDAHGILLFSETYDSRSNNLENFSKHFYQKFAEYSNSYASSGTVAIRIDDKVNHTPSTTNTIGNRIIDYEALFDSRTNHEVVFEKEFEQRRKTLQDTIEYPNAFVPRVQYCIGKGEKHYYQLESSETVRNAGTASFTVSCHDQVELAKGGFNFKVNERYDPSKKNEYAYPKGMIPEKKPEDTSLWEQKIEELEGKIKKNEDDIADYQQQITDIQAVADTTSNYSDRQKLLGQITSLRIQINNLNAANIALQDQLDEVNEVYEKYQIDYAEDLDGPYRIPTLENDLAGDFHLHWDANGTWSGNTYTRLAHIVGMDNGVKFIAEVSEQREEMRFLGIRYHRAIIGVEYRLVSEYETSEIVDVIKLTDDMSYQEKADLINNRRNEIQQEYPSCYVGVVKSEKDGIEKETPDEAFHLLWLSDRVALARFIEYRLRQIDGQLSFIERSLYTRKNVLADFVKGFMQPIPRWRTSNPAGAALQRWINAGTGLVTIEE